MNEKEETVSLKDAIEQVKVAVSRISLIHLGFAKVLVKELGDKKGKELIIKSMMEYGKLVGKLNTEGYQDLPHYGIHDKYSYSDQEFLDTRKMPISEAGGFDYQQLKIYGCAIAQIFKELGEEELGRLYCYVDSAKSMATDPNSKLIHTACVLCGDDYCGFNVLPTDEKEREDFENNSENWKNVDPILV